MFFSGPAIVDDLNQILGNIEAPFIFPAFFKPLLLSL